MKRKEVMKVKIGSKIYDSEEMLEEAGVHIMFIK